MHRQDHDRDTVEEEAAQWFARLRAPDCSDAERAAFARWRAQPAHAAAYAAIAGLWDELGSGAVRERLAGSIGKIAAATAPPPARRHARRLRLALAAALVAGIAVFALGWQAQRLDTPQVHASAFGETRTILLEDGSELVLNSASEVAVRMSSGARELTLRRGEALFNVRRDPARPFLVRAGDSEVQAVGTRFVVRQDAAATVVTLLSGRVTVADPEVREPVTMAPGEELSLQTSGEIRRRRVDPEMASAWTRGRLLFRATPLSEAVEEINRYVEPKLRLADPALAQAQISGSVKIGNSESVVRALAFLLPLRAEPADNGDWLLTARAEPPPAEKR